MRKIMSTLLNIELPVDWMLATMILAGTTLILRADEICTMEDKDFPPNGQVFDLDPKYLTSLQVNVCGKTDVKNVCGKTDVKNMSLIAFVDDECPIFCFPRLLLTYMKKIGYTGGYLLPGEDGLKQKNFSAPISYQKFLDLLQRRVYMQILGFGTPDKPFSLGQCGTHALRKTAYTFALWGILQDRTDGTANIANLHLDQLMKNARHTCVKTPQCTKKILPRYTS
jgi:hypothetical protein